MPGRSNATRTIWAGAFAPRSLKLLFLVCCKCVGIFWVFRCINRRGIRILCYHGFALSDAQTNFRPKLFMDPATFRRRMEWLKRAGYRVISLGDAVDAMRRRAMPKDAAVITMDDGLYGCFVHGVPIAQEFQYPVTVYVTTWYVENRGPIANLVVSYVFWRAGKRRLETPDGIFDERTARQRCIDLGSLGCIPFFDHLADAAGVPTTHLRDRRFTLMTANEIGRLAEQGIDVQLHTHRHRWPNDENLLRKEIEDNRAALEPLVARPLRHLCYPSGVFSVEDWPLLRDLGIASATTLERGMAEIEDDVLRLPRLLDGSNLSQIEFEARMCGVLDFFQAIRKRARNSRRTRPTEN